MAWCSCAAIKIVLINFIRMHLSKALQPGLHIPLGLRKLFVCLQCKGKTSKSMSISNKNPFMKCLFMQYHYSPLTEDENQPGTELGVPGHTAQSLSLAR